MALDLPCPTTAAGLVQSSNRTVKSTTSSFHCSRLTSAKPQVSLEMPCPTTAAGLVQSSNGAFDRLATLLADLALRVHLASETVSHTVTVTCCVYAASACRNRERAMQDASAMHFGGCRYVTRAHARLQTANLLADLVLCIHLASEKVSLGHLDARLLCVHTAVQAQPGALFPCDERAPAC